MKGAAKYINANGGIAGRKLAVDFIDSKLNANDARNAIITACEQDFAVVGSAVLFLSNVEDEINCKDVNGKATGLPDVVGLSTGVPEACSPVSFPVTPPAFVCDTVGQHPQTIQGNQGEFKYYIKKLEGNAHGALLIANDTPDARRGGETAMALVKDAGVKADVELALSSSAPQSAYTPVVQQMKSDSSNFSYLTMSVNSAIQLRQEAALQGFANPDTIWACPSSCYDLKAMKAASSTMEGEWVSLTFLPFAETSTNKMLANFVKYTGKDNVDGFAVWGWAATIAFQDALTSVVEEQGVNAVTRANLLESLENLHSFDAGGMIAKTDVGNKIVSPCFNLLQWKSGKFVRNYPTKKGTFDCKRSNYATAKLDLLTG